MKRFLTRSRAAAACAFAAWGVWASLAGAARAGTCQIVYDPGAGKLPDGWSSKTNVTVGSTFESYGLHPVPTYTGAVTAVSVAFHGWAEEATADPVFWSDALGKPLSDHATATLVTQTLHAVWGPEADRLVVTSLEDGETASDPDKVTLRGAIKTLSYFKTGPRTITFDVEGDAPATLTFSNTYTVAAGMAPFVIDGDNGGRGILVTEGAMKRLGDQPDGAVLTDIRFLQSAGDEVILRHFNFDGLHVTGKGAVANVTAGGLMLENCAIRNVSADGGGGAVFFENAAGLFRSIGCSYHTCNAGGDSACGGAVLSTGDALFVNNAFCRCVAQAKGGAFSVGARTFLLLCTVTDCETDADAQYACDMAETASPAHYVAGSLLYNRRDFNLPYGGSVTTYAENLGYNKAWFNASASPGSPAILYAHAFADSDLPLVADDGEVLERACGSVTHRVICPLAKSACFSSDALLPTVLHDAAWTNVCVTSRYQVASDRLLLGIREKATEELTTDILGETSLERLRGAVRGTRYCQVAFETNGGTRTGGTNEAVAVGAAFPDESTLPTRPGCAFLGWYAADGTTCYVDANGEHTETVAPDQKALTVYAKWSFRRDRLVVTDLSDSSETNTLRALLRAVTASTGREAWFVSPDETPVTIRVKASGTTVDLAQPLEIPSGACALRIDGANGGRGLVLRTSASARLVTHRGSNRLTLENLTLQGGFGGESGSAEGGGAVFAAGPLFASNVLFEACYAACGGGAVHAKAEATFLACTFAQNLSYQSGAAALTQGETVFADCTFCDNVARDAATGIVTAQGKTGLFGCTFAENVLPEGKFQVVSDGGAVTLVNTLVTGDAAQAWSASGVTAVASDGSGAAADRFGYAGACQTTVLSGVTNGWYAPMPSAPVSGSGKEVWHAADWSAVAYADPGGGTKTAFRGAAAAATLLRATDQLGATNVLDAVGASPRLIGAIRSRAVCDFTFDSNGGGDPGIARFGTPCLTMPAALASAPPYWSGRTFRGWYSAPTGGEAYYDESGHALRKAPFAGLTTLYAQWKAGQALATVTTGEDGMGLSGGRISFREAVLSMAGDATLVNLDGIRHITFSLAEDENVVLTNEILIGAVAAPFAIDGLNGGKGVTLAGGLNGSGEGVRCLRIASGLPTVTLANLTFRNFKPADGLGGGAVLAGSPVVVTNGRFTANGVAAAAGAALRLTQAGSRVVDTTFDANTGDCAVRADAAATFVNVSCFSNVTAAADLYVSAADVVCANVSVEKAIGAAPGIAPTAVNVLQADACSAFVATQTVGTVTHLVHVPFADETATGGVLRVWHDAAWTNVATATASAGAKTAVRGSAALADACLETDLFGAADRLRGKGAVRTAYAAEVTFEPEGGTNDVPDDVYLLCGAAPSADVPVMFKPNFDFSGWYDRPDGAGTKFYDADGHPVATAVVPFESPLTLYAGWKTTAALLRVTAYDETQTPGAGQVTLHDALRNLRTYTGFAERRITFAAGATVCLTNSLVIPSDTEAFAIDGSGGVSIVPAAGVTQRLIVNACTNLTLENLTLGSVDVSAAGGEAANGASLHSSGSFTAKNCLFASGKAKKGGALCVTAGTNLVLDCSFYGNEATDTATGGGALYVTGGRTVVAFSSFLDNKTASGGHGAAAYAAASAADTLAFAACSFAGNATGQDDGNTVYASRSGICKMAGSAVAHASDAACELANVDELSDANARGTGADLFQSAATTRNVKGVTHHFRTPRADGAMKTCGRWFFHDDDWRNIALSKVPQTSGREDFVGQRTAAYIRKNADQLGAVLSTALAGAVTVEDGSLVVTTTADVVDPSDGVTSLREAINAACNDLSPADPDTGVHVITFDSSLFTDGAATVALTNGTTVSVKSDDSSRVASVRIQGRTDGKYVTILGGGDATVLNVSGTTCLELADLTVTQRGFGCFLLTDAAASGTVRLSRCTFGGWNQTNEIGLETLGTVHLVVSQCSFVGDGSSKMGGVQVDGSSSAEFVNCTFSQISTAGKGALVIRSGATVYVVNTTVESCTGTKGGVVVNSLRTRFVNGCFYGNRNSSGASADLVSYDGGVNRCLMYSSIYQTLSPAALLGSSSTNNVQWKDSTKTPFAYDAAASVVLGGARRWYRPLARQLTSSYTERGCFTYHDAAWTNVAWSLRDDTSGKIAIVGSPSLATTFLATDILGRPMELAATPGSYATVRDAEDNDTPGIVKVNQTADDTTVEKTYDDYHRRDGQKRWYDGRLSLREAVKCAQETPSLRDANGDCTVTFGAACFANQSDLTTKFLMRQIEVTGFTNGSLTVTGPTASGRSLSLDGNGANRLFYVAPGNDVRFLHLTFTNAASYTVGNAVSVATGGAILNDGALLVSNCAFRACAAGKAYGKGIYTYTSGWGDGGAVATRTGGRSVLKRCSFVGNRGNCGGAVYTQGGATSVVYACTFAGNRAVTQNNAPGYGGAIYCGETTADGRRSDTLLIHATLAANAAESEGGGVYVARSARETAFTAVSSIFVANTAANAAGSDLAVNYTSGSDVNGRADLFYSYLGSCNVPTDADDCVRRTEVTPVLAAADVLAICTTAGVPLTWSRSVDNVLHDGFPLIEDQSYAGAFVWADAGWQNVGCAETAEASSPTVVRGILRRIRANAKPCQTDQVGNTLAVNIVGALAEFAESTSPTVDPEQDPLVLTDGSASALLNAIAYAAAHPALATNDGAVAVRYNLQGNVTVNLDATIAVSDFSSVALLIDGGGRVTLSGQNARRLFDVAEGNDLRLANLTLANGRAVECGGGIYAYAARVFATNCTFSGCTAVPSAEYDPMGGAVCMESEKSVGDFWHCSFVGCHANGSAGEYGKDIYHDDTHLALHGCTFDGATSPVAAAYDDTTVAEPPRAKLTKADGRLDFFDTIAAALNAAREGDTVARLVDDASTLSPTPATLATGVSYRDESGANPATLGVLLSTLAASKNDSLAASGQTYFTASVVSEGGSPVGVSVALNEEATPTLDDDDASLDLTSDPDYVSVVPANVKPNLYYGLGYSDTPGGDYTVDVWVRSDADGNLPEALMAPKSGARGFYKVFVKEY